MRRSIVIAAVLLAVAFLFVGGPSLLFSPSTSDVAPETEDEPEPEIVSVEDSESGFWPYLNAHETHEQRSALNVVVRGETDTIVRLLAAHGEGDWEETEDDHFDADELVEFGNETDEQAESPNDTAGSDSDANESTATSEASEQTDSADSAEPPETDTGTETAADSDADGETGSESASGSESETDGETETESDDETGTETETETDTETDDRPLRPISPTDIPWSQADGATRFAYLDPGPGESAYWTTETLQLEDGEYYGYRYHIRLYESPNPDDQWAVMQTHSEHFDWFTLRHRVDGVEAAQMRLEADLMEIPGVDNQEDLQRIYLGNSGPSDADGWATKVDLTVTAATVVPIIVGVAATRRRAGDGSATSASEDRTILRRTSDELDSRLTDADRARLRAAADRLEARHLILVATVFTVILGVRIAGIALDRSTSVLTVHTIAALLYPLIAVGLPVATYLVAGGLERRLDAAVTASLSLAVAIWLDYSLLGVDVLPLDVVVQRMLVVVALGLIAGGAARRATRTSRFNDMLLAGVGMWVLVLAGTLLGYL